MGVGTRHLLAIAALAVMLHSAPALSQAPRIDVHAHRGGAGLAPENTLAAFRHALTLGVDVLEMDLHVSADGEVVVIHDASLERTTNGRGFIRDMFLADIRRFDAGSWFDRRFAGERVPTLRDVLDLVQAAGRPDVRLNLETKYGDRGPQPPPDFEARVLQVLRQARWLNRVIIQSFNDASLAKVKSLDPGVRTAVLRSLFNWTPDPVQVVRRAHGDLYSPHARLATHGAMEALHRAGIPVVPWTVNQPAEVDRLVSAGLGALRGDGIITDYPDRVIQVLRDRGLRR